MDPLASIPSSITYEGGDLRGTISPGESTDKNDGPASSECPTLASTALNLPHPVALQDHREGGVYVCGDRSPQRHRSPQQASRFADVREAATTCMKAPTIVQRSLSKDYGSTPTIGKKGRNACVVGPAVFSPCLTSFIAILPGGCTVETPRAPKHCSPDRRYRQPVSSPLGLDDWRRVVGIYQRAPASRPAQYREFWPYRRWKMRLPHNRYPTLPTVFGTFTLVA